MDVVKNISGCWDVARVFTRMLQLFYLDVVFSSRDLEYFMQHQIDVAASFFSHHWWMDNNLFQHALMLQTLIFGVAYVRFSMFQMLHGPSDGRCSHRMSGRQQRRFGKTNYMVGLLTAESHIFEFSLSPYLVPKKFHTVLITSNLRTHT